MPTPAPANPKEGHSSRKQKSTAFLIAVHQKRETVRVYAVLAVTAETALTQVRALATDAMKVEMVGALSRDVAKRLGLKPGEMRLV
jgi:hypothetical protein